MTFAKRIQTSVGRGIPIVLTLSALIAIALWGHFTDWKLPNSGQAHATSQVKAEDWCEEHGVPESKCIACHPELVGANPQDWCKEHGVAESKCTVCHPEILKTGVAGDWCREHGVPESQCTICHPEIAVKGATPIKPEITVEADAAAAGRDPKTCQTHNLRVQFASPESVRKAGVEVGQVEQLPFAETIEANAELAYDQTRFAEVAARVPGTVWRVDVRIGQQVRHGDVLALVDASAVGAAKAELLKAAAKVGSRRAVLDRTQTSTEQGFRNKADLQTAEAELKEAQIELFNARQALINLGLSLPEIPEGEVPDERAVQFLALPEALTAELDPSKTTANLLPVTSPLDGVIVSCTVVAGEVVETSKTLFHIADTSHMWVKAQLRPDDADRVAIDQTVVFRSDGHDDEAAIGKVTWISTGVDEATRTVQVRADVDNADGHLRANTFGKARVTIRSTPQAIVVPDESVHWEGCCNVVFVKLTDEIFQTRKVRLGAKMNGFTEILVGVLPGETVATKGSYVLKSQILKSSLGAGCTDD